MAEPWTSGFLGLRFFQEKYGPDAGIFDSFDWLNPKYRDHFYENMANTVSPELSYPILSSFRNNPESQKYLQTLTYKTAMVLSMLEYLMGNRAFRQGLQHFAQNNQGVLAGQKEFQVSMEKFNDPKRRVPPLPSVSPYGIKGKGSLDGFSVSGSEMYKLWITVLSAQLFEPYQMECMKQK